MKMKIYKVLIAALAVFSVCLDGDLNAQERSGRKLFGRKNPTKKELVQENQRMRSMIDSLMLELQALEDTAYVEEEYVEAFQGLPDCWYGHGSCLYPRCQ